MNPFYKIILNNNAENNDTSVLGDLLCRELGFLGSVSTAHGSSDFATVPVDVKEWQNFYYFMNYLFFYNIFFDYAFMTFALILASYSGYFKGTVIKTSLKGQLLKFL